MPTEMDIVSEVVRLTGLFRHRAAHSPAALYTFLADHGIDVDRSVALSISTAEQGVNPVAGLILDQAGRFHAFDLDCDLEGSHVTSVHDWSDVTTAQNVSAHNPGFGRGRGRMALDVQLALNTASLTPWPPCTSPVPP